MNKFSTINKDFIDSLNENGGKLLNNGAGRKIFCYQRNRVDDTYYLTQIKGNWIKSFKIRYLLNGKNQNLFLSFMVGGLLAPQEAQENANHTQTVKEIIVKSKFNEHQKHLRIFKEITPDLDWFGESEEDRLNDNTAR